MSEERIKNKEFEQAIAVYNTLTNMLDGRGWKYKKETDKLLIKSEVRGDDLPIDYVIVVNPVQQIVEFLSVLPFRMSEEKRLDGAIAICVANYGLCDGSFDYDVFDGEITFRLTTSYRESVLGEDLFEYMITAAASTIDHYNDKFLLLSKGVLSLQDFIEQERKQ